MNQIKIGKYWYHSKRVAGRGNHTNSGIHEFN